MDFKRKRIIIVHHNDGDGICSAALFALTLKRLGNFPLEIISPEHVEFDDSITRAFEEKKPNVAVVLDLPLQLVPKIKVPALVIDHHPSRNITAENCEIVHDTSKCAAYLTYRYCEKLAKIKDIAWIAAIGCMSDKDKAGFDELMPEVKREFPEISEDEIQKMMSFISSGKLLGQRGISCGVNALIEAANMGIPTALLGSTPNAQKLQFLRKVSRKERDYWLLFHRDFAKIGGNIIYYKINTQLPIQSYLAGTLANLYPQHLCLVASNNHDGKNVTVEGRTKLVSVDIGSSFFEIAEKLGGNGGGLKSAGGIKVSLEKENEFLEEIKKRLC